jgi:hypothetical protein
VAVRGGGTSMVLWQEGLGTACVVPVDAPTSLPTECRDLTPGDFAIAPVGGGFAEPRPGEVATLISTFFPYAGSPIGLGEDYVLPPTGRQPPAPPPEYNRTPSSYR